MIEALPPRRLAPAYNGVSARGSFVHTLPAARDIGAGEAGGSAMAGQGCGGGEVSRWAPREKTALTAAIRLLLAETAAGVSATGM